LIWDDCDFETTVFDCSSGGWTDGGDLQVAECGWIYVELFHAGGECVHAVDAGENEPVIFVYLFKGRIERFVRVRLADFDERNFDDVGAKGLEAARKRAGLMARAADENAQSGEGLVRRSF